MKKFVWQVNAVSCCLLLFCSVLVLGGSGGIGNIAIQVLLPSKVRIHFLTCLKLVVFAMQCQHVSSIVNRESGLYRLILASWLSHAYLFSSVSLLTDIYPLFSQCSCGILLNYKIQPYTTLVLPVNSQLVRISMLRTHCLY